MNLVPFGWQVLQQRYIADLQPLKLTARLMHTGLIQVASWLDDLLMPKWRQVTFQGPVFIIGHQRSGTTAFHRSLAAHPANIGATLGQMLAPALCLWQLGRAGARLDNHCGGHLIRWLHKRQNTALAGLASIHPTGFDEVEEDEFFFWSILASGFCAHSSARAMDNTALEVVCQPINWTEHQRLSRWRWYSDILRKLVFFSAGVCNADHAPWVVSKNPVFSRRIPELLRHFPDARFIVLHRDPRQAIASRLHLVETLWALGSPNATLSPRHVERIYQDSLLTYRALERDLPCIPHQRCLQLSADFSYQNPEAACKRIESAFGLQSASLIQPGVGRTHWDLGRFGLAAQRVEDDLTTVFERRLWDSDEV